MTKSKKLSGAAKADTESKPVIAVVKRCACQNQKRSAVFPQPLELMPFPSLFQAKFFSGLIGAANGHRIL